ncbi:MAG: DUF72 domain-containing protein [Kofleriaceae bacterium]
MSQLALFDDGNSGLDLAPVPDDVYTTAAALPPAIRFGTMSWAYPGWIGPVYADHVRANQLVAHGLTAYAKHPLLRTVELDRTYYDALPASYYQQLAAQVPSEFRFVAKAHEDCTTVRYPPHARYGARAGQRNPRLLDAAYTTDHVIAPFVEGLGRKAGALIFQFSPFEVRSPERFAGALHDFLRKLPRGPLYAVEVRNAELMTAAYAEAILDADAVHCHNAWGWLPDVVAQRALLATASQRAFVARWLTRAGDSHEAARQRYLPFDRLVEEDLDVRDDLTKLTREAIASNRDGFVLVANKAEGSAPETIRRLAASVVATAR